MMSRIGLALIALTLVAAAPPKPATAPVFTRSAELERRLQAVVAKSPAVWRIPVRHMERQEVAGVRADERFLMASAFKVPILVELYHQVSEGKIPLDERVELKEPERYFGSGVLREMRPGLNPTIHD